MSNLGSISCRTKSVSCLLYKTKASNLLLSSSQSLRRNEMPHLEYSSTMISCLYLITTITPTIQEHHDLMLVSDHHNHTYNTRSSWSHACIWSPQSCLQYKIIMISCLYLITTITPTIEEHHDLMLVSDHHNHTYNKGAPWSHACIWSLQSHLQYKIIMISCLYLITTIIPTIQEYHDLMLVSDHHNHTYNTRSSWSHACIWSPQSHLQYRIIMISCLYLITTIIPTIQEYHDLMLVSDHHNHTYNTRSSWFHACIWSPQSYLQYKIIMISCLYLITTIIPTIQDHHYLMLVSDHHNHTYNKGAPWSHACI